MVVLVMFDASASGYEVKAELNAVRAIEGVQEVRVLERQGGEAPRFCVEIAVDDDSAGSVTETLKTYASRYAANIENVRRLTYRVV